MGRFRPEQALGLKCCERLRRFSVTKERSPARARACKHGTHNVALRRGSWFRAACGLAQASGES